MRDLPANWESVQLIDLVESTFYGPRYSATSYKSDGVPTIRTTDMDSGGHIVLRDPPRVSVSTDELTRFGLAHNDLLVTRTGSIGRCALYKTSLGPALPSAYLIRVRLKSEACDAEYVLRFMMSPEGQGHLIGASTAVTQPNVNAQAIGAMSLPLPPIAEQRRIVAKIEALTAKSRHAKAALDAIPALLERFRQSVLAAAFRGELTAAWREKNPDVEPAEKLLKRIRAERRRRWEEAEFAKMRAKGKVPGDDRWKGRYEEPPPVDVSDLPELPEGWSWTNLETCAYDMTVGHVGKTTEHYCDSGKGVPFLRSQNVRPFRYNPDGLTWIAPSFHESLAKSRLSGGELLVVRVGANLGDCCIYPEVAGEANCANIIIVRPLMSVERHLLARFMNSPLGRAEIKRLTGGSAQGVLNVWSAARIRIPLPPEREQTAIKRRAEAMLTAIDAVTAELDQLGAHCDSLDRAILAKAFRGDLVPQDPNDEPASTLLERLRAEREQALAAQNDRSKTKPRTRKNSSKLTEP